LIDLVRAGSIAIVLLMHWLAPAITFAEGKISMVIVPGGPAVWVATWFIQVMPVIFIAGGVANTAVITEMRLRCRPYAEYLSIRARRLAVPVAALVGVVAVVSTAAAAAGFVGLGEAISQGAAKPLWFLAVYLFVVAFAPAMVAAQRRFGVAVLLALAVAAVVVDAYRFAGNDSIAALNLAFVWLFAHQLGIAYATGMFAAVRTPTLVGLVASAALTCVLMVTAGPYPPVTIGVSDAPLANLVPPTAAMVALAVGQCAVIVWLSRRFGRALATPGWRRFLAAANRPLMTIYLWHLPAMMVLVGLALPAADVLLPQPGAGWWLTRPIWLAGCALILLVLVRVWHRFERLDLPALPASLPTRIRPPLALFGAGLATVGVYGIWQHGMLLTGPGSAIRTASVLALALALVLLAPTPSDRPVAR
jgi:Acyltransferase family